MGTRITCKQAVDFISKKENDKLSAIQRVRLWQHLSICSICKIFNQQNKMISRLFPNQPIDQRLSDNDKEKIIQSILRNEENKSSFEKE